LQATDVGRRGDKRWLGVYRLTPGVVSRGGGDGRTDAHATDAGVSVCRSVFGGLASIRRCGGRATDADVSFCRSVREGGFGAQERRMLSRVC
jgi:hypothetical protein